MENQARHIELASRIFKEDFKTSWRISGFNLMPFQEDHPVYGPWFMLGKTRASQWSVLVTKENHGGVKNIGFRLVRSEEGTMWDMVTFSLGLKFEDGRFLQCIDKQVVGKECNNYFNYLVKTIESELKERVTESDCPTPLRVFSNHLKSCEAREQCIIRDLRNVKDCPYLNGSSGIKGAKGFESSCSLQESSVVRGSTTLEDNSLGEGPSGVKETTEADIERRDSEIISQIIAVDVENCSMSDVPITLKGLTNIEKSTEAPKTDEDVKNKPTPEELFQQETITVVCEIEYTYMMPDPITEDEETEQEDIVADFGHLFTSGKFSDITVKCGDSDLPCHKAVLYTRSLLFKAFLDKTDSFSGTAPSQQPLIVNVNFDLPTLKAVLLYMYANELDNEVGKSEDNCWKLYKAAGVFGVPGLRNLCLEVLEENDECHVDDSKNLCKELSILSIYTSNQKLSVDVLSPVTNTSTQTSMSN